jgi:Domain of unknown function (DUF4157)
MKVAAPALATSEKVDRSSTKKQSESLDKNSYLSQSNCTCGGGCPRCSNKTGSQATPSTTVVSLSAQAAISSDHILEHDADYAADRVMSMPTTTQTPTLSTVARSISPTMMPSGGQPLTPAIRAKFEPRYGVDLGHVRIHSDTSAAKNANDHRAHAFTHGSNIVFGRNRYAPGTSQGDHLIAHELAHVVQQTIPASKVSGPVSVRSGPLIARSVDEWLQGSVHIGALSYTQLVGELDELNQWLQRQTTSSEDTARIEEAIGLLRTEINRREAAAAGPRRSATRRGSRSASRVTPTANSESLPERYPRVLIEMTSVAYENPAEMRAEYDLIMQWLARTEISANERRIMTVERDNLAPQLNLDRQRVVTERHAERIHTALTAPDPHAVNALQNLARTIQGISNDPGNPNIFYIYNERERIAISREQAESLRNGLRDQIGNARRRIDSRVTYYWERYHAQAALNREHPIISRISGWLADVEDPRAELYSRYVQIGAQLGQLQGLINASDMVAAATVLPDVENNCEHIRSLARAYYEGYIEGAEIAVRRLEFTRDASFALAGSIAAVVAAPVVAGAVGVGGLGLTGTTATIATVAGTGVVVGTGMATVRGGSAATGVLLSGGTLEEAGSAFTSEAWRGFREGFLSGAGGAAARSVGLAINAAGGSMASQIATRVGAEMLINGTTTMIDTLARGGTLEDAARAAVISAAQAVPGALLGGSNNPAVRNLLAPFTASGTSYLAARANGASAEEALAQAGVALASNIAMSRALHSPEADAGLVERGRSIGAGARDAVTSTTRRAAPYLGATMIGLADALPPLRSGFGGTSIGIDIDNIPSARTAHSVATPSSSVSHHDMEIRPSAGSLHAELESTSIIATPRPQAETEAATTPPASLAATPIAPAVADDLNIDAAFAPGAPAQVSDIRTVGRTVASGRSRNFASLSRIVLSATQRIAAIRLHGQRMGSTLSQAWNQSSNAREAADIATIRAHWSAGRQDQARALARAAFDRHRSRFWRAVRADPSLQAVFTDAGMVFLPGRNTPVYIDPTTGDTIDFMSLEHSTRLTDDPTLALNANNLQTVLGDENSVYLEAIRREDPFQ